MRILLFVVLAGCVTATESGAKREALAYGCDELVVVGRVETLSHEDVSAPEDILGHAAWDLKVKIKRVVHGAESRHAIPAVGISHAQIRDDADLLIVLARQEQGYIVRTLSVIEGAEPRLQSRCT